MTTIDSTDWIERVAEDWRGISLIRNHVRAANGEIPTAQAPILADMAANQLKELLTNGERTRQKIAEEVFRRVIDRHQQQEKP